MEIHIYSVKAKIQAGNIWVQAFIQALLCTAAFPQRLSFINTSLVHYL